MFGRGNDATYVDAVVLEPGAKKGGVSPVNGMPRASYEFQFEARADGAAAERVTASGQTSPMCVPPVGPESASTTSRASCPQCGAPVDQSTAEQAEHPTPGICHAPLPVTSY